MKKRLEQLGTDRWAEFRDRSQELLDSAVQIDGATKGNLQLFNYNLRALQIVLYRGFEFQFLKHFEVVRTNEDTACGRAFRNGVRVMIPDVTIDPLYAPYVSVAREHGFRAVQSTPIVDTHGSVIGVMSTHFPDVHHLSLAGQVALDSHAAKIATLIQTYLQYEA